MNKSKIALKLLQLRSGDDDDDLDVSLEEIEEGEELSEGFEDELYISSSDEGDIEETISTVDQCIESVVLGLDTQTATVNLIEDESVDSQIDTSSKSAVIWTKLDSGDPKSLKNRVRFTQKVGPTAYAASRANQSALSAFLSILDLSLIQLVVQSTNQEAAIHNSTFQVDSNDILAFIAIQFCRGIFCGGVPVRHLWSKTFGIEIVKNIMSKGKFLKIMKFLRFDDKNTREVRKNVDKFAAVREIWNKFIYNSMSCWQPGQYLTIDEQLLPNKSRCPITQYIPTKPDKFGIKFWMLVDVESKYICNAFPYCGKQDLFYNDTKCLQGEYVIKTLMENYINKGHHVTSDNFFTSLDVANYLMSKQTTFLGTIKKNKRELPTLVHRKEKLGDTKFFENDTGVLLTVHQGKSTKNVVLLSTLEEIASVPSANNPKKKTVDYYKV